MSKVYFLLVVLFVVFSFSSCEEEGGSICEGPCANNNGSGGTSPEVCGGDEDENGNPQDEDGDGYINCADSDCTASDWCHEDRVPGVNNACGNGIDDDGDGEVDCDDDDCINSDACTNYQGEDSYANGCSNGEDDDGDGNIDCLDSDCSDHANCQQIITEDCSDGMDNDKDSLVDCADPDCANKAPCFNAETDAASGCSNNIDDDGDGYIDCADADCQNHADCVSSESNCSDGLDNDNDGLIDCNDDDCDGNAACNSSQPQTYMIIKAVASSGYTRLSGRASGSTLWLSSQSFINTNWAFIGNVQRPTNEFAFAYDGSYTGYATDINIAVMDSFEIECHEYSGSFSCDPSCWKGFGPVRQSDGAQVNFGCVINDQQSEAITALMSSGYFNISSLSSQYITPISVTGKVTYYYH